MDKKKQAKKVISLLSKKYSAKKIALKYGNKFQLLVAVVLSAQCTDKRVNEVTKKLFKKYKKPADLVKVPLSKFEQEIRSTGFYRNKAKNLKKTSKILVEKYNRRVPSSMDDLLGLPGVARKTANIILSHGFGKNEGVAIDTHVKRVAYRLGLTEHQDPAKIEKDLMRIINKKDWGRITNLLISLGRDVCKARRPKCEECVLNKICPSALK